MTPFNPERLTLARQRRGLTKTELASAADISVKSISTYEAAQAVPGNETLQVLAKKLGFPFGFFFGPPLKVPDLQNVSFRAMSTMTASQRDAALGSGAIATEFADLLAQRLNLPAVNVPDLKGGHKPEAAADEVRATWGLGVRPIQNMIHRLEVQGVRVFSLTEECRELDAFSFWRSGIPFVFLNTMKSTERSRFDAAHELGHLILHRHGGPRGRSAEKEADAFASAFLMPRASVLANPPGLATLQNLITLKRKWNVSVSALAHRLRGIGLLSEWQYRELCIEIGKLGYRRNEPNSIERERSQLLEKALHALRAEGLSKRAIAHKLQVELREVDALVFGLTDGESNESERGRFGHLRLVE